MQAVVYGKLLAKVMEKVEYRPPIPTTPKSLNQLLYVAPTKDDTESLNAYTFHTTLDTILASGGQSSTSYSQHIFHTRQMQPH